MATIAIAAMAPAASAETLLMPDRDMQTTVSEVVRGITTLPNGSSTYDIDFGDASAHASGAVGDRSYIAVNHTYALAAANVTVTLKVTNGATVETATATVNVYNRAALAADAARQLDINRTIQNGLRYLWYSQFNRTTFDTNIEYRVGQLQQRDHGAGGAGVPEPGLPAARTTTSRPTGSAPSTKSVRS